MYICAVLITIGICIFMLGKVYVSECIQVLNVAQSGGNPHHAADTSGWFGVLGIALTVSSLACDAMTGNLQDKWLPIYRYALNCE